MRNKGKRSTSKNKNVISKGTTNSGNIKAKLKSNFNSINKTKKSTKKSSKHKTVNSQHNYYIAAKILAIFCVVSVVIFEIMLIKLNILPAKYMLIALLVFTPLGVLTFLGLFFNKIKKKPKITAAVVSVILIIVSFTGTLYITGTMNFLGKISSVGETFSYEEFYVIAKADSKAEQIEDLDDTEIGILSIANENYSKARNELKDVIECEYKSVDTLDKLGSELLEGTKESIFLSETNYSVLDEGTEGYKEDTKIIYTIKIKTVQEDSARRVNVTEEPFNIYVSGIDTYGKIGNVSRSDVNMIVTVNPKTNQILLTSIPRDCVVTLPSFGEKDKLTHAGVYGTNESIGAIENLLDIKINYYLKVNFSSVENLVDAINGIEVDSDYTFTGEVGGYRFVKGMNSLTGKQALSFSRERHSFTSGDFQRVKNQQKVIEAIITKITSSSTLLLNYNSILNSVKDSMDTNFSPAEIKSLVKMQVDDMPSWAFDKHSIDQGSDASLTGHSYPYQELYMLIPDNDAVVEAADKINAVMSEE